MKVQSFLISEKIRGTAIGDKFDAVQNITLSSYLMEFLRYNGVGNL